MSTYQVLIYCIILTMLPSFPNFKQLTIDDKKDIEEFVSLYPPYSDYNLISLFTWNSTLSAEVCLLNGNLVAKFADYTSDDSFFSFLGTQNSARTVETLLNYSSEIGLKPVLKLVPEVSVNSDESLKSKFHILEDRDNFDYIFSIPKLVQLDGGNFAAKRNFIKRFKESHPASVQLIEITEERTRKEMLELFHLWRTNKNHTLEHVKYELSAISKLLEYYHSIKVLCVGIFIDSKMVAFSINEVLPAGYAINLFEKANTHYIGIFPFLRHEVAKILEKQGCQFLNFEQDLGVEGLRKSKLSYHPENFLKKYTITPK